MGTVTSRNQWTLRCHSVGLAREAFLLRYNQLTLANKLFLVMGKVVEEYHILYQQRRFCCKLLPFQVIRGMGNLAFIIDLSSSSMHLLL